MHNWTRRRAVAAVLVAAVGGCSGDAPPQLHPVTGTVTRGGKPVAGGGLIFAPASGTHGGLLIDAPVGPDGRFAARTSRLKDIPATFQPGAPAGEYTVTYHPASDGQKMGLESVVKEPVRVQAGANAVAIDLPADQPKGHGAERNDVPAAEKDKDAGAK